MDNNNNNNNIPRPTPTLSTFLCLWSGILGWSEEVDEVEEGEGPLVDPLIVLVVADPVSVVVEAEDVEASSTSTLCEIVKCGGCTVTPDWAKKLVTSCELSCEVIYWFNDTSSVFPSETCIVVDTVKSIYMLFQYKDINYN